MVPQRCHRPWRYNWRRSSTSSRDEEIAKLEEQLRRLKEEENDSIEAKSELTSSVEVSRKVDPRVLEKVKGKDMILSERDLLDAEVWNNDESLVQGSNGFASVPTVLAIVGAAIFLFFFAQVPIGQEDLSRFSVTGSSSSTVIDLGDLNPDRDALSRP